MGFISLGHRDAVTTLLLLTGSQTEPLCTLLWEALTVNLPGCFSAWRRKVRRGRKYQIPDVSVIVPRVPACRRTCCRSMRTGGRDSTPTQRMEVKAFTEVTEVDFYLRDQGTQHC